MHLWILSLAGCFQVIERPVCVQVASTAVGDAEQTLAGSAQAVWDAFEGTQDLLASYPNGQQTQAELSIEAGGSAAWVELESAVETTRKPGFGGVQYDLYVSCEDYLEVPVSLSVQTEDGELAVAVPGTVRITADDHEWPQAHVARGTASLSEVTLPPSDLELEDPAAGIEVSLGGDAGDTATVLRQGLRELDSGTRAWTEERVLELDL